MLLGYPNPLPEDIATEIERSGRRLRPVDSINQTDLEMPEGGWAGAVVYGVADLPAALAFCHALAEREPPLRPVLIVVERYQLGDLRDRVQDFDDFCVSHAVTDELAARLDLLLRRMGRRENPEVVTHGPLVLNIATYQAAVDGRALDLTYMEYELLRFLATRPGKVFTREVILSRVWGYEYYGGARTVDVHVRRLRAKLGEEHANLIQTVRSVGYRFGDGNWMP